MNAALPPAPPCWISHDSVSRWPSPRTHLTGLSILWAPSASPIQRLPESHRKPTPPRSRLYLSAHCSSPSCVSVQSDSLDLVWLPQQGLWSATDGMRVQSAGRVWEDAGTPRARPVESPTPGTGSSWQSEWVEGFPSLVNCPEKLVSLKCRFPGPTKNYWVTSQGKTRRWEWGDLGLPAAPQALPLPPRAAPQDSPHPSQLGAPVPGTSGLPEGKGCLSNWWDPHNLVNWHSGEQAQTLEPHLTLVSQNLSARAANVSQWLENTWP